MFTTLTRLKNFIDGALLETNDSTFHEIVKWESIVRSYGSQLHKRKLSDVIIRKCISASIEAALPTGCHQVLQRLAKKFLKIANCSLNTNLDLVSILQPHICYTLF